VLGGRGHLDRQRAAFDGEDRAGGALAAHPDVVPGGPSPGPFGQQVVLSVNNRLSTTSYAVLGLLALRAWLATPSAPRTSKWSRCCG
jgi:hypothetical protein